MGSSSIHELPEEEALLHIDDLRDDVLVHILSFLPTTKQRAATSLVSRRWRHLWTHIPSLNFWFDDSQTTYPDTIEECLRRYSRGSRPLHCFSAHLPNLSHERPEAYLTIDRWLRILSTTSLRVLSLRSSIFQNCLQLPPSVLSLAPSLRVLKLFDWDLTGIDWAAAQTPHHRGFNRLDTLVLDNVAISEEQFRALLAACPLLENLMISSTQLPISLSSSVNPLLKKVYASCDIEKPKPFQVRIDLPDLEMLILIGETMRDLRLAGSPQLREVWVLSYTRQSVLPENLSGVQAMPVTMSGVQIMAANPLTFLLEHFKEHQEFAFPNLKVLYGLGIPESGIPELGGFYNPQPNSFVSFVSFLERCPSLDTLYILLDYNSDSKWEDVELDELGAGSTSSCPVRTIIVMDVTGHKRDKALMKYLLGKMACLECLSIIFSECNRSDIYEKEQLLEEVRLFARASPLDITVQTRNAISFHVSAYDWFQFY